MKRMAAVSLALVMAVAAGCGGAKTTPSSTPAAGGSSGGEKVIKIGLIAPLSGDVKTFGESTKNAFELALAQAGNKVGDYKIETVISDDRNDPTEGVNIATKMTTQQGVKAIIGSVSSKVSIPVGEVANAQKVPMITPTSTNTKVTVDDKGAVKPFVFRACFIDPFQGQVAAKFASTTLKAKTAAVLYDKGNDYTVGLSDEFKKNFEAAGGKVVAWESYSKDDSDFSAIMTKVVAVKPDMLYLPDYYNKVSLIAKTAKAKGLNVPMMGGDGWDSPDLDYEALDGGYFTNHYSADDTRPEVQNFVKAYGEKFKDKDGKPIKPDALAALAYDATNILLEGIKQAKSDDAAKIQAAIKGLKDFTTVSGKITYDQSNNPIKSAAILQVKKDKTYAFVTTVSP
jgi:branched-chain amino acid transport system substrate-binding protein